MIDRYLNYVITGFLPDMLAFLDSLIISEGVSWLGLSVAITLLCIVIGSIVMRVAR